MNTHTMTPAPPVAKTVPKEDIYHGERRDDPYFWLREKTHPDTAAYLHAENAYADASLAGLEPLRNQLYEEILSHIKQTDVNVPYRKGDYLYYSRTEEGKQYAIYCRKRALPDAPESITLDLNAMAQGHSFMSLGAYKVSDDGNLLAYTTDVTGFRQYTLHVKDLRSGENLPDTAERVNFTEWASDNRTLFYVVEDDAKRPYRLYRHTLGQSADQDALVYEETDPMFNLPLSRTRSGEFLLLTSESHTTTEVRFCSAHQPEGEWTLIATREQDHEYYADHRGDLFYFRTNSGGRNFRLVTAPLQRPGRDNWAEIVPHRVEVMLEDFDLFASHLVLTERTAGLPGFHVTNLSSGQTAQIRFPEPTYHAAPQINVEWETTRFRYSYQSFVTPPSVFDYDMVTDESVLLKQTEVPGGFERDNYRSERIFATASDGVQVPISLVYRVGFTSNGSAPLCLRGYGSYGINYPASFSASNLPLLDRGVVIAIAHIRGGGEMGKAWHDAGRMMNKMNSFTDFIACSEHLLANGYVAKDRLAITGGSAGGLLMGAVVNMRPDLFRCVLSYVPFVDVINTMMDASLPLTVIEYEEWGNPNKEQEYRYMSAYCPYTNLRAGAYPAMLIRTSFNDSQVMYWEPAKYTAKLRTLKNDDTPLFLKTDMSSGHGGASGRYDAIRDTAYDDAFLLSELQAVA